ncbi:hypothetical protein UY3_03032 [Chelonia mydas]|uniref:Uncharacterized protein n=1 Tax=Chelonia mydas TaxID=8469 RepID=M7CFT5_CHEMY|nr:hypothetical protein UY3_03032 [Chelonia mydas]
MTEKDHDRDTLQCRVKVKELQNTYQKAREANHRFSAVPMNCRFYKELDVILGGDPTSTVKTTVDTSVARMQAESGPSQEEEILDEEGEGDPDPEAEDDSEARDTCSQEPFSIPEETSQSQLSDLGQAQTGEEAPAWRASSSAEVTIQSSSAQVTMESQNRKRAPAWTEREERRVAAEVVAETDAMRIDIYRERQEDLRGGFMRAEMQRNR